LYLGQQLGVRNNCYLYSNRKITQKKRKKLMDAAAVTAITGAVDFATIITGIGAIAGAVALVYIAVKGSQMVLAMVSG
jgi:hypothetical protein